MWVVVRRRFRGSYGATRQLVVEVWLTGQRLLSGTRSGVPVARRSRNSPITTSFAGTSKIAWAALSPARMASWCQAQMSVGSVAVTGPELTDGGQHRGVPSKSQNRLRIDFPDNESMRISHEAIYQALLRARSRCAPTRTGGVSCEPGERCGSQGPGHMDGTRSSSAPLTLFGRPFV